MENELLFDESYGLDDYDILNDLECMEFKVKEEGRADIWSKIEMDFGNLFDLDLNNVLTPLDSSKQSELFNNYNKDVVRKDCMLWSEKYNIDAERSPSPVMVNINDIFPVRPAMSSQQQQSLLKTNVYKQASSSKTPADNLPTNMLTPPRTPPIEDDNSNNAIVEQVNSIIHETVVTPNNIDEFIDYLVKKPDNESEMLFGGDDTLMEYRNKVFKEEKCDDDVFEEESDYESADEVDSKDDIMEKIKMQLAPRLPQREPVAGKVGKFKQITKQEPPMLEPEPEEDTTDDTLEQNRMEQQTPRIQPPFVYKPYNPSEGDHSYHALNPIHCLYNDTPSDSDSEIDVVSVKTRSLPNNPTNYDRQQIQRRMVSAMMKTQPRPPVHNLHSYATRRQFVIPPTPPSPAPQRGRKATSSATTTTRSTNKRKAGGRKCGGRRRRGNHNNDDELEPHEKRKLHNNMERKRRIELRNSFESLRMLIPAVSQKEKASKVLILKEACGYCRELRRNNGTFTTQKEKLQKYQRQMMIYIKRLRLERRDVTEGLL